MIDELMQIFRCKCEKNTIPDGFEVRGDNFKDVIEGLEQRYGVEWMKNNLPNVGELLPSEHDTSVIEQLNFPESKVVNNPIR
jgi:hypothetical protein